MISEILIIEICILSLSVGMVLVSTLLYQHLKLHEYNDSIRKCLGGGNCGLRNR